MNLRVAAAVWALVASVVVACALPALSGGFVYDDQLAAEHPLFAGTFDNVVRAFVRTSHDYVPDMLDAASGVTYRPLSVASLALTNALFGRTPWPHHLLSLGLHLLTCTLIAWLGFDLRTRRVPPVWLLASALFALHPLVGETYLWISGRNDLLAGCALAATAALLHARRQRAAFAERGGVFFGACALVLTVGALAKEPFLVAATFLLAAELVPRPASALDAPSAWPARLRALLPLFAAFALAVITLGVLRAQAASGAPHARGAGSILLDPAFLLRVPHAFALGLEALLLPAARPMRALSWEFAQAMTARHIALLAVAVAFAGWIALRRRHAALVLLAGAAATLAPTAAVADYFWLGFDRYVLLSLILLLAALATEAHALQARLDAGSARARRSVAVLAACAASWFAYSNWTTATFFESQVAFARALITARPEDPSGFLVGAAQVDDAGRADLRAYLHSLSKRDLPPAFSHAAATAQSHFGLYREVVDTVERAALRFPENSHVRFDLLELRGSQHRFGEALQLSGELLRDARLCPVIHAKLNEWDGAPGLPDSVRQRLRAQLAAHPCG